MVKVTKDFSKKDGKREDGRKRRDSDEKERPKKRKVKDPSQPKQAPKTVESKRIFDPEQLMDEETLADMDANDEFASFFSLTETPKILITTSRRPKTLTHSFADELADLFPHSEYRKRPSHYLLKDVVKGGMERGYTHLLVVNESRKVPNTLSVIKLPEGPTAIFQLTSVKLGKQIHNHGRATSHTPELILNHFVTKVGHRIGRLLVSLFPQVPQFTGRQVVTFHNQRDFIFVRRHRYIFDDEGRRARLQEIGPQFTIKLRKIVHAAVELDQAEVEFEWDSHASILDKRKFVL